MTSSLPLRRELDCILLGHEPEYQRRNFARVAPPPDVKELILRALGGVRFMTLGEIATQVGVPEKDVDKALSALRRDERVVQVNPGALSRSSSVWRVR